MKTVIGIVFAIAVIKAIYSLWNRVELLELGIVELAKQTLPKQSTPKTSEKNSNSA